jgi:hypothetical protein
MKSGENDEDLKEFIYNSDSLEEDTDESRIH